MQKFYTETGIHVPAVSAGQMQEIDRIAMEQTGPNLFQMMENAGRNLAELTIKLLGDHWNKARILVIAGTGGNSGGGICAARHLSNRNAQVNLCLTNASGLAEVTAFQRKVFHSTFGHEIGTYQLNDDSYDFVIDALIGYSLKGPPTGITLELIQWANQAGAPILSLDLPSGIDANDGSALGEFIHSGWTMTLALPKLGLLKGKTGHLFLADIGIPVSVYRKLGLNYASPFEDSYIVPLITRNDQKNNPS